MKQRLLNQNEGWTDNLDGIKFKYLLAIMTAEERHRYYVEVINPRLDILARLICEASRIEDQVLRTSRYQDLLLFYEEQVGLGFWHPKLAETVADFTAARDAAGALPFYRLALEQAKLLDDEIHTILIAMAQALFDAGQTEQAETCLSDGRAEALRRGDNNCVLRADEVRREFSGE